MARTRSVLTLVVLAVMGLMLMACEETGDYTLTITGPDEMKASEGARFTGTVTGVTPVVGYASYWWYLDANDDEWPQEAERVRVYQDLPADADGIAAHTWTWNPSLTGLPRDVTLSVLVQVKRPGTNLVTNLRDEITVTVKP